SMNEHFRANMRLLDDSYNEVRPIIYDAMGLRIQAYTSIDELRKIALLLLEHGANPNEPVESPMSGYTPLMLAAEIDEPELFKAMLEKGGDLNQTYTHPYQGRQVGIEEIAYFFKSNGVLETLAQLQ
ncbi:MAG: hypothetical protein CUN55_19700, partial [Phototrophicales bacterium]